VIQDITERKRAEASLRESEDRFRVWLDATDSIFWTAGPGGELVQPSPSLERITGMTSKQCLGHGRLAAVHPDDRDDYLASVANAIGREEFFESHLRYWHADSGEYRWYLERGVPDRAEDGTVRGWLGAGVNIDRQKKAEASQQDLLRRKDEFIAMLGHELRNPLAPLQNASEVLRDGLRLVEQREAEDAGKLRALRSAARVGVGALDRGEFKEFGDIDELRTYLNDLSEKIISKAAG
jgi:antitoxin ParD1/3/4